MDKIKSYIIIEGKYGYVECIMERKGSTYKALISKAEFDFRMWKQKMIESKKLKAKDIKKIGSLVEEYVPTYWQHSRRHSSIRCTSKH